jgi:glycosyltransferase involved in cell wall biosynthesis
MLTFNKFSNPILIVSDNPALQGGLSRMCRDLASLTCTMPQFRVAVMGRGPGQRSSFPWLTYDYPESEDWGQNIIAPIWSDFAGEDNGVIITLDDLSRRTWFANPVGQPPDLQKFLGPGRNFLKWAYVPLDSTGPAGTLTYSGRDTAINYDRILASSEWGCDIIKNSGINADWLPHGIWIDKFYPHPSAKVLTSGEHHIQVGCVMANQSRKDYPAAFECFAALKEYYGNRFRAWLHTNAMIHYWNIYALAVDYGVTDCLEITMNLNDSQLAQRYSACDCTILPSGGEGFGYPIAESLACGTPCIVTDYAGGQELVEESCRVTPLCYRTDTQHNSRRAVLSGYAFGEAAKTQIERKRNDWEYTSLRLAESVSHLSWLTLKSLWENWLVKGLGC